MTGHRFKYPKKVPVAPRALNAATLRSGDSAVTEADIEVLMGTFRVKLGIAGENNPLIRSLTEQTLTACREMVVERQHSFGVKPFTLNDLAASFNAIT